MHPCYAWRKMRASRGLRPRRRGARISEPAWLPWPATPRRRRMSVPRPVLSAALLFLLPLAAHAQSVRGVVVDAGDRPVAGVVVLLLDSASQVTARALSNERGEFRVASSRPGSYRIRTLRIGFRPVMSEPAALTAGSEIAKRVVLSGLPIALDTMRVVDRN